MRQRSPRLRAGFVAALAGTAAIAGFFFNAPAAPAQTPVVIDGRASAYAVQANVAGLVVVPPTPDPDEITVVGPECPETEQGSLVDVIDTEALQIGAADALARCNEMGTPASFFEAEASVATVRVNAVVDLPVGPDQTVELFEISGVHTECRADAEEVDAVVTVADIDGPAGAADIPVGEFDTQIGPIDVLGIAQLTIHETVEETDDSIVVNGIRLRLIEQVVILPGVPVPVPIPAADIIIGHVECSRVLGQVTTTTTQPGATTTTQPGATTTTQPGATTTTTRAATTTTAAPGATTTTVTLPPGVTTSVAAVVVQQQPATSIVTVSQLARTGADVRRAVVWGVVAVVLGLLMTMGNRGLSETTLAGATSYGPTAFPESKRRRRRPAGATRRTLDSAALDALIEMDGGGQEKKG